MSIIDQLQILAANPRNMGRGRIGTALRLNNIATKYRDMPIIGRGATSIILDAGNGKAIVLTRDTIKREYLRDRLGAKELDAYDATNHPIPAIGQMPVYVLEMPKLHKLSANNRRWIKEEINQFEQDYRNSTHAFNRIYGNEDEYSDHPFHDPASFLSNYDASQYYLDLDQGQFMQDDKGNIICVDPAVSTELLDVINADKFKRKYKKL